MDDSPPAEEISDSPSAEEINESRLVEEIKDPLPAENYKEYEEEIDTSDEEVGFNVPIF